ncbi:MAG: hypothetical protein R3F34_14800 [Planctomycetota bacterium]
MERADYYNDLKWCDCCEDYVRYLQSMEHSYCVACGSKVRLFSEQDWQDFTESVRTSKPKGGRPRKKREAESA